MDLQPLVSFYSQKQIIVALKYCRKDVLRYVSCDLDDRTC
jgi:hypothetical protein